VQTYHNQTTVEEEAPRAREVVSQASGLLEKLVADIRLGQSFEVERVEEIVDDMVESIVRNPQALMWVAKLREQDITAYGHGLQVSVYLTSFGRHLGFPRAQLSHLAQVGCFSTSARSACRARCSRSRVGSPTRSSTRRRSTSSTGSPSSPRPRISIPRCCAASSSTTSA
jgi:hypothetical protein